MAMAVFLQDWLDFQNQIRGGFCAKPSGAALLAVGSKPGFGLAALREKLMLQRSDGQDGHTAYPPTNSPPARDAGKRATVKSISIGQARIRQLFPRPPQAANSSGEHINENFPSDKPPAQGAAQIKTWLYNTLTVKSI